MEGITKTTRALWICVPINMILVLVVNGCFLQQAIANLHDGIGGAVKTTYSQAKPPKVFE